jgi:hypothetical protein
MTKFALLALSLLVCLATFSCQTYTSGLKQSLTAADETSATGTLRTIALAQKTYTVTSGGEYATFQQLSEGGYLDSSFNADKPAIKDYVLTMEVTPKANGKAEGFYSCNADPTREQAGRHFYIDSTSSETHVNPSAPATANDPTLQP